MVYSAYALRGKSILLVTGILLMVFLPGEGFAFRIDKGTIKTRLSPGEKYNATVVVDNPAELETRIKVYINDFVYIPPFGGDKEFYPPESTLFSLAKWVTFSPQEFTIPPFSRRSVNIVVEPRESFDLVHCGVIFFESTIGVTYQEGEAVNVLGRIGTLMFIEPLNQNKKVIFNDIKGGRNKISGVVQNAGNTFLHIKGTFFIMNNEGMVSDRGQIKEVYLLPEDKIALDMDILKTLSLGDYISVVTFDLEDNDVAVKEIDFSVSSSGDIKVIEARD